MKIVYSTESIDRNGGIQTVTIVKANFLAEIEGNEVYIVVPHMFGTATRKISDKVHIINLDIKDYWVPIHKQPGRNRLYKKLLQEVFEEISPDIVIYWLARQELPTDNQGIIQPCFHSGDTSSQYVQTDDRGRIQRESACPYL